MHLGNTTAAELQDVLEGYRYHTLDEVEGLTAHVRYDENDAFGEAERARDPHTGDDAERYAHAMYDLGWAEAQANPDSDPEGLYAQRPLPSILAYHLQHVARDRAEREEVVRRYLSDPQSLPSPTTDSAPRNGDQDEGGVLAGVR